MSSKAGYDFIGDLKAYSTDIACWRIEQIERYMRGAPDDFPDFIKSRTNIETAKRDLIQKLDGDELELQSFMLACMAYHSELLYEVYKQAVLDSGRIHHAFTIQELPRREEDKP